VAEVQFKIRGDDSDLDRMSNKVREFEHNLTGAFKRTGDIRAGSALEGFIQNLTSGNVPGAIESIASRLTGLGLIGGAVAGSIALGFSRSAEEAKAFAATLDETEKSLLVAPNRVIGAQGLTERLKSDLDNIQKIQDQSQGFFRHLNPFSVASDVRGIGDEVKSRKDVTDTLKEQRAFYDGLVTSAKMKAAADSEAAGALQGQEAAMKALYEIEQARAKLASTAAAKGDFLLSGAINKEADHDKQAVIRAAHAELVAGNKKVIQERYGGVSSDELLAAGALAPNEGFQIRHRQSFPVALQGDAYRLRTAEGLLSQADHFRSLGLFDAAKQYGTMGEQMKSEVHSLNPNERLPEYGFKNALDTSGVLRSIDAGIKDVKQAIGGISFKNQ
jgi:hypothetical protein